MTSREARHLERAGRVPPADCKCAGCAGLAKRYKSDPDLLAFYRRRLLQNGWAGNADEVEKAYQMSHAAWARARHESGIRLQQAMAQRGEFPGVGEASAPKDEEVATAPAEGGSQGTLAL
jgi:hypothetical protein